MLKIIISVKDTVSEVFNDPRVEVNAASAIRAFSHSVQDTPHKDDFVLYQIGIFETTNGTVKPNEPIRLFSGHDVQKQDIPETLQPQSGV